MSKLTRAQPVEPQAPAARHVHSPSCSASPSSPPPWSLGDTMPAGFRQRAHDGNAGTDVVVRSADRIGSGRRSRRRGVIDASDRRGCRPRRRCGAGGARTSRASPRSSASTAKPIGGDGPPTRGRQLDRRPGAQPVPARRGARARARCRRRGRDRPRPRAARRPARRRPHDRAHADRSPSTIVGIATFGDADSLGPTTLRRRSPRNGRARCSPAAPTADRPSILRAAGGDGDRAGTSCAPAMARDAAARDVEALTGGELTAEQQADIDGDFLGLFETFLLVFAGDRPGRRDVQHPQHVLDPRRPAHPRVGAAAGARRVAPPGRRRSSAPRRSSSASSHRGSGFAAGIGLAAGLLALIEQFRPRPCRTPGSSIGTSTIVAAVVVGVGVTLLASLAPAIKASRGRAARRAARRRRRPLGVVEVARRRRHRSLIGAGVAVAIVGATSSPTARWPAPGSARWRRSSVPSCSARSSPARRRRCSASPPAGAPRHRRPARPAQRDAQPAPHRGQRLGADGRHRRRRAVHHVRRLDQGVDRRHRRRRRSPATS